MSKNTIILSRTAIAYAIAILLIVLIALLLNIAVGMIYSNLSFTPIIIVSIIIAVLQLADIILYQLLKRAK